MMGATSAEKVTPSFARTSGCETNNASMTTIAGAAKASTAVPAAVERIVTMR